MTGEKGPHGSEMALCR